MTQPNIQQLTEQQLRDLQQEEFDKTIESIRGRMRKYPSRRLQDKRFNHQKSLHEWMSKLHESQTQMREELEALNQKVREIEYLMRELSTNQSPPDDELGEEMTMI